MKDEIGAPQQDEIDELNRAVNTLDAEVQAAAAAERQREASGTRQPLTEWFLVKWFPLTRDWKQWMIDHPNFPSRLFQDPEFEEFRVRYNRLRTDWTITLKQTTTAPEVAVLPGGSGVSSALESAFNKLLLVGAGLGTLYLVLRARERHKERS